MPIVESPSSARDFWRIWRTLPGRRRGQFAVLALLSVVAALTEALAIGSAVPFLFVLSNPTKVFEHPIGQEVASWLRLTSPEQLLLPVSGAFCAAILLTALVRLATLWAGLHVSLSAGSDLRNDIFKRAVHQPYISHLSRTSTELMDLLSTGVNTVVFDVLIPLVSILSSVILAIAVMATLVAIDPKVAVSAIAGVSAIYAVVAYASRNRLVYFGLQEASGAHDRLRTIQESFGGMRDVLLNSSQSVYERALERAEVRTRKAVTARRFMGQGPRYVVEALAMTLITVLAYALTQRDGGIERSISVIGAFALGAQRLLPAAQTIYLSWSSMRGSSAYLFKLRRYLMETAAVPASETTPIQPLPLRSAIEFDAVSLRYPQSDAPALRDVSLRIPAGSRTGIIGPSGSGKSTLVDVLMGLLEPTQGSLKIDGVTVTPSLRRQWQANIAHVPQSVFLTDSSIAENIAFGVPREEIDWARISEAAEKAHIADFIRTLPGGYDTRVGERGVRLSGGQRQRLGIARALYRRASVLVFDEATSALDSDTETAVMAAIDRLSHELTIVMIAHRISTLRGCDRIIEISDGSIRQIGAYADVAAE